MFLKRVLSLFLICLGLVFVSCSDMECSDEGSLSLTFNGSDFLDTSARDIYPDSSFSGMYIVASVLGDYSETKKLEITNAGKYKIKFDYVPKGASVYVRADVFRLKKTAPTGADEAVPFKHLYTGQSKKKPVTSKNEKVNIVMKNMVDGCSYSDDNNTTTINKRFYCSFNSFNGEYVTNSLYMFFFNNGKYQIVKQDNSGTGYNVLSEGVWAGRFDKSGYIYITELIYDVCSYYEQNSWLDITGNFVMPEPKTRAFWFNFADGTYEEKLTIQCLNGLSVTYNPS